LPAHLGPGDFHVEILGCRSSSITVV